MRYLLFTALVTLAVSPVAGKAQALPAAQDYDSSWAIETSGASNLYEIELPFPVYQATADINLRDVAVFDSQGEPVPRLLRSPKTPDSSSTTVKTRKLKLFPVLSQGSQAPPAGKLMFQQSGEDTILTYEGSEGGSDTQAADQVLSAYVMDLSGLKHSLHQLNFEWPAGMTPFIVNIKVEGSSDLSSWTNLGQGSIAELKLDDASIVRSSVTLRRRQARYLRITWTDAPDNWQLSAASGRYRETTQVRAVARNDSRQLSPDGRDESDGGYVFDLGGAPAVTQVQLSLPADNTVIRASIYVRQSSQSQWRRVGEQLFYHLQRGQARIENDALSLSATRARLWKVVVESGRPEVSMSMQLQWQPDRLQFVAQGMPPYELVAGRPEAQAEDFPMEAKFGDADIFQISRVTGRALPAVLGEQTRYRDPASGDQPTPVPWRKWALWAVLILGVLAVATMAMRLLRQLDS